MDTSQKNADSQRCGGFVYPCSGTIVQDSWAEGLLRALIETGPALLEDPGNVALWNGLMYRTTIALNGFISMGCTDDWVTHRIGHELTALYGLDHARSLAVVLGIVKLINKPDSSFSLNEFGI